MKLCPDGAEGSSYSMLTTFSNIAGICSSNLGNLFAGIWSAPFVIPTFFLTHFQGCLKHCDESS
jgi:hypothetical protein